MATAVRTSAPADRKLVSISSKRQVTIPQRFFTSLGFSDEAEFIVRGNELVLRPVKTVSGGEFAEQILSDLIAEGFTGKELLAQFKARQAQVRPAVQCFLKQKPPQSVTRLPLPTTISLVRRIDRWQKYVFFHRPQNF